MLIQRWYRRYLSRIELRKQTAWHIYQSIEYSGQQDQLKLYDFFLKLIKNSNLINDEKQKALKSDNAALSQQFKSAASISQHQPDHHQAAHQESNISLKSEELEDNDEENESENEQDNANKTNIVHKVFTAGRSPSGSIGNI